MNNLLLIVFAAGCHQRSSAGVPDSRTSGATRISGQSGVNVIKLLNLSSLTLWRSKLDRVYLGKSANVGKTRKNSVPYVAQFR